MPSSQTPPRPAVLALTDWGCRLLPLGRHGPGIRRLRGVSHTEWIAVGAQSLQAFAFRPMRFAPYAWCRPLPALVTQCSLLHGSLLPLHAGLAGRACALPGSPTSSVALSGRTQGPIPKGPRDQGAREPKGSRRTPSAAEPNNVVRERRAEGQIGIEHAGKRAKDPVASPEDSARVITQPLIA